MNDRPNSLSICMHPLICIFFVASFVLTNLSNAYIINNNEYDVVHFSLITYSYFSRKYQWMYTLEFIGLNKYHKTFFTLKKNFFWEKYGELSVVRRKKEAFKEHSCLYDYELWAFFFLFEPKTLPRWRSKTPWS